MTTPTDHDRLIALEVEGRGRDAQTAEIATAVKTIEVTVTDLRLAVVQQVGALTAAQTALTERVTELGTTMREGFAQIDPHRRAVKDYARPAAAGGGLGAILTGVVLWLLQRFGVG